MREKIFEGMEGVSIDWEISFQKNFEYYEKKKRARCAHESFKSSLQAV